MSRKKAEPKPKGKTWISTPVPNLIRYTPAGTYYARARIGGGNPIKVSLDTDDFRIAKNRLGPKLDELRHAAGVGKAVGKIPETLGDAVALLEDDIRINPALKPNTREGYLEQLTALHHGKNAALPCSPLKALEPGTLKTWWQATAARYAPQRANHLLMWLRRAMERAKDLGAIYRDPSKELKRVKVPRRRHRLLNGDQFRLVITSIRSQNKAWSREAGDWVEFMTYSGLRPGEISALLWDDVEERPGLLSVWGGKARTKNNEPRWVPVGDHLADLLARMRSGRECSGPVFRLKKPHDALTAACARLKLPHQRIYDLRHTFATMCAESGVDVATFAMWLGHRDGGTLAMRVYVHPGEEHSLKAIKKVKF